MLPETPAPTPKAVASATTDLPDPPGLGVTKEVVKADTVMERLGTITDGKAGSQRSGLRLALGVGIIIAGVTFALLFFLYKHFPDMPSAEAPKAGAADQRGGIPAQYTLDRYKSLSEIAVKSTQDIFQTIVAQALIPVLTAVLGYIFAKSGKDSDGQPGHWL